MKVELRARHSIMSWVALECRDTQLMSLANVSGSKLGGVCMNGFASAAKPAATVCQQSPDWVTGSGWVQWIPQRSSAARRKAEC